MPRKWVESMEALTFDDLHTETTVLMMFGAPIFTFGAWVNGTTLAAKQTLVSDSEQTETLDLLNLLARAWSLRDNNLHLVKCVLESITAEWL